VPAEVLAVLPRIESALAPFDARPHWGKLFVGSLPDMVMRYFRKFLRAEVVIPVIRNADSSIPLEGMVIRTNDGRTSSLRLTFQQFKACDTRFEVSKPLIFLYWKTNDIWSVIIPGKNIYLQLQTFYYDDKYQKRWETGEIISQVYLDNVQHPPIVQDFAALEGAYERLLAHGVTINSHRRLERQLALLDRKIAKESDWKAEGHVTKLEHHPAGYPLNKDFQTFTFVVDRWIRGGDRSITEIPFHVGWCRNSEEVRSTEGTFIFWGKNKPPVENAEWEFVSLLKEEGRKSAEAFLSAHGGEIGKRSTADLDALLAEC